MSANTRFAVLVDHVNPVFAMSERLRAAAERAQRHDLIDFAKTGAPPALVSEGNTGDAEPVLLLKPQSCGKTTDMPHRLDPSELALALRDRESSFNEDVLPVDSKPLAPRELYADAMWPKRAVPRFVEHKPWIDPRVKEDDDLFTAGDVPPSVFKRWEPEDIAAIRRQAIAQLRKAGIFAMPKRSRPYDINAWAKEVHTANAHWWHDPSTGEKLDRNMGEMLMLVVSEIAECMEGERKDLMDDHLPKRKMAEVELADAIIRLGDIIGSRSIDLSGEIAHVEREERNGRKPIPDNKGDALLYVIQPLQSIRRFEGWVFGRKLARTFLRIMKYADKHDYDLWGAVAEKREYNKHRADHKPEARLAVNGKKF